MKEFGRGTLGDFIELKYGKSLPAKSRDGTGYPVVGSGGVSGAHSKPLVDGPSIVVGRKGSIGEVYYLEEPCSPIDTVYYVDAVSGEFKYWYYLLKSLPLQQLNRATAIPGLNRNDAYALEVNVPRPEKQRLVVEEIELKQSSISSARDLFSELPDLIEKFRQSVLAAAFRGDLTKEWREQNPDVEPASVLLERIRAERKTKWIEDAAEKARARCEAKAQKAGRAWTAEDDAKVLEKERVKAEKKYKAPDPVDPEGLPELPETWCWARAKELGDNKPYDLAIGPFGSNLVKADYTVEGVPLIFVANIRANDFTPRHHISAEKAITLNSHIAEPGALLITKMGDPPGDTAIYPRELEPAVITADCIKMRPESALTSSDFLKFAIRTGASRDAILANTKGVAMQKISLKLFREVPVPLPPREEQEELERQLRALEVMTSRLDENLSLTSEHLISLEQSILGSAFSY